MKKHTDITGSHINTIYGIDFSGAEKVGTKIWITRGRIEQDRLLVEDCCPVREVDDAGNKRGDCLHALVRLIERETDSLFAFDFPFGLPLELVEEESWKDFVLSFPKEYSSPDNFRDTCRNRSKAGESKRLTDNESKTPFSPYNLRIFRQTFYGIRDVLLPLLKNNSACVLPMEQPEEGNPWILEICPASTLKKLGMYQPYKGRSKEQTRGRERILDYLLNCGLVGSSDRALVSKIEDNSNGDALDSLIGAYAAFKWFTGGDLMSMEKKKEYLVEGFVYV